MYFPRLPPKLLKLGQVPCRGNESGGNLDIRFCHFFDVVGSNLVYTPDFTMATPWGSGKPCSSHLGPVESPPLKFISHIYPL